MPDLDPSAAPGWVAGRASFGHYPLDPLLVESFVPGDGYVPVVGCWHGLDGRRHVGEQVEQVGPAPGVGQCPAVADVRVGVVEDVPDGVCGGMPGGECSGSGEAGRGPGLGGPEVQAPVPPDDCFAVEDGTWLELHAGEGDVHPVLGDDSAGSGVESHCLGGAAEDGAVAVEFGLVPPVRPVGQGGDGLGEGDFDGEFHMVRVRRRVG